MRFSQEFIDKVRDANSVVEIIGAHTELKGSGHRLMGRCPFPDHSDKSPSFSVSEDNQLYYCYGCKKGGNVFTFLESFNGMSFPEAIEYLARRASVPLPEPEAGAKGPSTASRDEKDLLLKVNKVTAVYFHQLLKSESAVSPVHAYLKKRGLSEEIVEKFRLGYSSEEWQGLIKHLRSRKIPAALGEKLGLFKQKRGAAQGAETHFDLFRDRLMFPIFSPTGDVIGFGGRSLGDQLPKYINSSDSPVFNKSKVLYGIHETGKFIRAMDSAIVVEGYMDALALYAVGVTNVVAILGTAFTADHARVLKRYTSNVTMLLDGDEAGITAAERSLPILLASGLMAKGFILPDKMDPDDFVKERGVEPLRNEIARAPELFNLLLEKRWMREYHGSASEKVRIVEESAVSLRGMPNRQLQELYMLELARQLDVDLGWVRRALNNSQAAGAQGQPGAPQGPRPVGAGVAGSSGFSSPQMRRPGSSPSSGSHLHPNVNSKVVSSGGAVAQVVDAGGSDENSGSETAESGPVFETISLKGAPRDESFVLSLLLHHEPLLKELVEAGTEEVLALFSHAGIRRALQWSLVRFEAVGSKGYSGIAADLATHVDVPGLVASSAELMSSEGDGAAATDRAKKLLNDYMVAIRQRFLKERSKRLMAEMKSQPSPEKLREFMSIQRDRLGLAGAADPTEGAE